MNAHSASAAEKEFLLISRAFNACHFGDRLQKFFLRYCFVTAQEVALILRRKYEQETLILGFHGLLFNFNLACWLRNKSGCGQHDSEKIADLSDRF
jgi:hypothetical protein